MPVRKRESKLFDRIKKNIKNVHFTRIESSTINGIPDVHGTGDGKSFWLELKSNTDKFPRLDKYQMAWCYNEWKAGGRVFILYQTLSKAALELYKVTGVPHQENLVLVHTLPDPVPVSRWEELRSFLLNY